MPTARRFSKNARPSVTSLEQIRIAKVHAVRGSKFDKVSILLLVVLEKDEEVLKKLRT